MDRTDSYRLMRTLHQAAAVMLLLVAPFVTGCERLDPPLNVQVELESWLRIEGTTSVSSFACLSEEVYGGAVINEDDFDGDGRVAPKDDYSASLRVPVHSLDCGRKAMNEDLYDALKVGAYPEIKFRLGRVEVVDRPRKTDDAYDLLVEGTLTIAGVERRVEVSASGRVTGDRRGRAYGRKRLQMSDFGIDPPTAMFGLIRAHDEIEVVFDVVGSIGGGAVSSRKQQDRRSSLSRGQ